MLECSRWTILLLMFFFKLQKQVDEGIKVLMSKSGLWIDGLSDPKPKLFGISLNCFDPNDILDFLLPVLKRLEQKLSSWL